MSAARYKMKDLCELTGLPRQAIHFYIHEGLVPEGEKTGKNMAFYGEHHVTRIKLIRQLQEERFLPLKAIRAVLEEKDEGAFTPAQRRLLGEVKQRLAPTLVDAPARDTVDVKPILLKSGVDKRELDEMVEVGLIALTRGPKGKLLVAKDDVWLIELWGEVRSAGFTRELGFTPSVFAIFEEAISTMFKKETSVLADRLSHLPADRIAPMVERILPLIHTFLVRYHETKVRAFFANM